MDAIAFITRPPTSSILIAPSKRRLLSPPRVKRRKTEAPPLLIPPATIELKSLVDFATAVSTAPLLLRVPVTKFDKHKHKKEQQANVLSSSSSSSVAVLKTVGAMRPNRKRKTMVLCPKCYGGMDLKKDEAGALRNHCLKCDMFGKERYCDACEGIQFIRNHTTGYIECPICKKQGRQFDKKIAPPMTKEERAGVVLHKPRCSKPECGAGTIIQDVQEGVACCSKCGLVVSTSLVVEEEELGAASREFDEDREREMEKQKEMRGKLSKSERSRLPIIEAKLKVLVTPKQEKLELRFRKQVSDTWAVSGTEVIRQVVNDAASILALYSATVDHSLPASKTAPAFHCAAIFIAVQNQPTLASAYSLLNLATKFMSGFKTTKNKDASLPVRLGMLSHHIDSLYKLGSALPAGYRLGDGKQTKMVYWLLVNELLNSFALSDVMPLSPADVHRVKAVLDSVKSDTGRLSAAMRHRPNITSAAIYYQAMQGVEHGTKARGVVKLTMQKAATVTGACKASISAARADMGFVARPGAT
jgi:hypothetical protein